MLTIRYLKSSDKTFWYRLDQHLPEKNLIIRSKQKEDIFYY